MSKLLKLTNLDGELVLIGVNQIIDAEHWKANPNGIKVDHTCISSVGAMVTTHRVKETVEEIHQMSTDKGCEKQYIQELREEIQITWSADDIIGRSRDNGSDLSPTDAKLVLLRLKHKHDASIGINWDVVDSAIENYCRDKNAMQGFTK